MSRSKRKVPCMGIAGSTEAHDKAQWHRRHRQRERQRIIKEGTDYVPRSHREHSDPWGMAKDGKVWMPDIIGTKWMRK